MKLYSTPITIELLKKHNPTFFSKDTTTFHGDVAYKITPWCDKNLLVVKTKLTGLVFYEINPDNYRLTYTTLTV